jgi:hypothetical protein
MSYIKQWDELRLASISAGRSMPLSSNPRFDEMASRSGVENVHSQETHGALTALATVVSIR